MEIIITAAIVAVALFVLIRKVKATSKGDCTGCSACDTDCSIYTPERAQGIEFIAKTKPVHPAE